MEQIIVNVKLPSGWKVTRGRRSNKLILTSNNKVGYSFDTEEELILFIKKLKGDKK